MKPGGVSSSEYSGETKSVKRSQSTVETVESVTRIPEWKRRLLAEDHTQRPSGTTERVTL